MSQLFRPQDVVDLAKLCHVLAAVFVDDGCVTENERADLTELVSKLERIEYECDLEGAE